MTFLEWQESEINLKEIDSESIIFWQNGLPFVDFKQTYKITYKGENIFNLRSDIDRDQLLQYISAFYRHFKADTLTKIIKSSTANQIKRLSQTSKESAIVTENNVPRPIESTEAIMVPFNLDKAREIGTFQKPNTIKTLAYLVLAEKYAKDRIPFDLVEANIFFKTNFKGNLKDVFNKCCLYHDFDPDEILRNYSNTIKNIDYYTLYKSANKRNDHNTVNALLSVFEKITK